MPQADLSTAEAGTDPTPRAVDSASVRKRALAVIGVLTTLAIVAAWFVFLRPEFLGGSTAYVLVSGNSMEPTLHDGDFVIARAESSYDHGDIVVYRIPADDVGGGGLVIHRIVGGSEGWGYILQGDNRDTQDIWRPTPDEIAGRLRLKIPAVGKAVPYLRSPVAWAAFAGVMAFLFIYNSGERRDAEE